MEELKQALWEIGVIIAHLYCIEDVQGRVRAHNLRKEVMVLLYEAIMAFELTTCQPFEIFAGHFKPEKKG